MNANKLVEDIYAHKLAKDTYLYRNSDKSYDVSYSSHSWFALNEQDANHEIKTRKELRLLNVLHPMFRMDYVHRVNTLHPLFTEEKAFMLLSLGLPSHFVQDTMLTHKPGICNQNTPETTAVQINADCYGGTHRYSFNIGDRKPDDDMVAGLIKIYQDRFDGFIIPHESPSCYHGGSFHPEVCLFRPKNATTLIRTTESKKPVKSKGGNNYPSVDTHEDMPFVLENVNNQNEKYLQSIKWDGPRVYDNEGVLKVPTLEEIVRYRSMCLPKMSDFARDDILESRRKDGVYTPHYDEEYWATVLYNFDPEPKNGGRRKTIKSK